MKRICGITLYIFAFMSLAVQCDKNEVDPIETLNLLENVSIKPFKKEYKVGDTIWLETLIPDKKLFTTNTNKDTLIDNMDLPFSIYFFSRHPRPGFGVPADENDFQVVNPNNLIVQKGRGGVFTTYGCNKPDYKIKLGLVLGNKGVFTIGLNYGSLRPCVGSSQNTSPSIRYQFDITEGNKEIYLGIPQSSKHINDDLEIQRGIDAKTMVAILVK